MTWTEIVDWAAIIVTAPFVLGFLFMCAVAVIQLLRRICAAIGGNDR